MRERQHLTDLVAALLEHLDVGVQEAIDRLELVADEEELVAGDEVDQLALEPVRVLELVDADLPEAQLLALADRFVIAEQVAGPQLEVVVVERGLVVLRRLVAAVEAQEELLSSSRSRAATALSAACSAVCRACSYSLSPLTAYSERSSSDSAAGLRSSSSIRRAAFSAPLDDDAARSPTRSRPGASPSESSSVRPADRSVSWTPVSIRRSACEP